MSLVEKVSNVLDDRKEAVVTTPLLEQKSLTKDVDKGTSVLEDVKEAVVTILRKKSDKFEVQCKGSTGWFKVDSELKKIYNSPMILLTRFEQYIESQDTEIYKTFIVSFDKEFTKTNM